MSTWIPHLRSPPIVEAVLDMDCDPPAGFELPALESAFRERLKDRYPDVHTLFVQEHKIEINPDAPSSRTGRAAIQAIQFFQEDHKQLVQVRAQGFSFNRLAPYTSLDDYLPEIERAWRLYVDIGSPVQVRLLRLRYINRILLPVSGDKLDLEEFLKIAPRVPDVDRLTLASFLIQQVALDSDTGHQVNLVLAPQSREADKLPIVLDIAAASQNPIPPADWPAIRSIIQSLRNLKNRIFVNTLTGKCIQLFQS